MTGLQKLAMPIASALADSVKAHSLPMVATAFGLANGEESEALKSKFTYVSKRLAGWSKDRLLELAKKVIETYPSDSLQCVIEEFDPLQPNRISLITRQHLFSGIDSLPPIGGKLGILGFMESLWPLKNMPTRDCDYRCPTAYDDVFQHMVRNDDYSFSQMLEHLDLAGMSNKKLVELLEQAVHPLVRVDGEQQEFVEAFNTHLKHDGLALVASDQVSGFPVYRMLPLIGGVSGTAKNLIFASNGPKPEIVLSDAINNDIKIVKHEQHCLVYDRPLTKHGLLWKDLIGWWCDKHGLPESDDTERGLYGRLAKTLASEPERLFFKTYFKDIRTAFRHQLPALIPQVYLHYDPYTMHQLRGERRLPRQRMDFLLLFSPFQRIVIEIDGKQHYSVGDVSSPKLYAEMVEADRDLRLLGYDVYRFGGAELHGESGESVVREFFFRLFEKLGIRRQPVVPTLDE